MKKESVDAQCSACGGTGLYCGMCEANGEAVVCLQCNGTGCQKISYIPFTKRLPRRGVKTVRQSRGTFILSAGGFGDSITYAEFIEGKMPSGMKR